MQMILKVTKLPLLVACMLMSSIASISLQAEVQSNSEMQSKDVVSTEKSDELAIQEEVVVYGFRESLDRAERDKKLADGFIDGVSSQGLGEFADENVGDALFSMPGVDIDFSNGIADGVTIGGMPSEYNDVQINGASLGAVNDSASFVGEGARTLGPYSTAILSGVKIYKSSQADLDEGSLGGQVNLLSWEPLFFKKPRMNISATSGYHDLSGESDGKLSFLWGGKNVDETFGYLLSLAKEVNKADEHLFTVGSSAMSIRNIDRTTIGPPNPDNDPAYLPNSNRETVGPSIFTNRMTQARYVRDNIVGVIQSQVSDNLLLSLEGNFARYNRNKFEQASNFSVNAGRPYNSDDSVMQYVPYSAQNLNVQRYAQAGIAFANTNGQAGSYHQIRGFQREMEDEVLNLAFKAEWDINDDWKMTGKFSRTENSFSWYPDAKGHHRFNDYRSFICGVTDGTEFPEVHLINEDATVRVGNTYVFNSTDYPSFNINDRSTWDQIIDASPIDPANYSYSSSFQDKKSNEVITDRLQFDFVKTLSESSFFSAFKFGVKYSKNETEFHTEGYTNPNMGGLRSAWVANGFNLSEVGYQQVETDFLGGHNHPGLPVSWVTPNWLATQNAIWSDGLGTWEGLGFTTLPDINRLSSIDRSELKTFAAYFMAQFDDEDRWLGNFGVRIVKDDFQAISYILDSTVTMPDFFVNPTNSPDVSETTNALDQAAISAWMDPSNFTHAVGGRDETYYLPSLNARYTLSADNELYLRFSASKVMARAPSTQTWASVNTTLDEDTGYVTIVGQNPALEPTFSNNYDLGIEWYASQDLSLSAAYRYKKIKNVRSILSRFEEYTYNHPVNGPMDAVMEYRVPDPNGDGTVDSLELRYRQHFSGLPGLWGNTGLSFNYTYTDSQVFAPTDDGLIKLNSASKNAYNTQLYYQGDKLTVRLAYTWRDPKIVRRESIGALATWEYYRRNLNSSMSYRFNDQFRLSFNIQNLLDKPTRRVADGDPRMLVAHSYTGRHFLLGLHYDM